jgi:DNA-binding response OmpR family regulator
VENSQILRYKNISFNTESKKVMTWKKSVYLTNKETQIAYLFMSNKWKMLSKTDLIDFVWWDYELISVTDNTINSTLSKVRKKLWKSFKLMTKINEWYILED